MIQWVVERCQSVAGVEVAVATDDERIRAAVTAFGGQVVMTRSDHENGTQRIAEVARSMQADIIVNVQGDEPLIEPAAIEQVIGLLQADPQLEMATLAEPITQFEDIFNPHVVKVVCAENGNALYFSRAPIPFMKHPDMSRIDWPKHLTGKHFRHVGIYGYRRDFLLRFADESACDLEQFEGLEQLRALVMGARIRVGITHMELVGVDTPEDLDRAEAALARRSLA